MELRYLGFDQQRNARVFRFEVLAKGESTRQANVSVDMALFLQNGVGIQDGPTLCAAKLTADLQANIEGSHTLTHDDLRAHASARAAAEAKRAEARSFTGRRHHTPAPAHESAQDLA
jgi:hypothetical protein